MSGKKASDLALNRSSWSPLKPKAKRFLISSGGVSEETSGTVLSVATPKPKKGARKRSIQGFVTLGLPGGLSISNDSEPLNSVLNPLFDGSSTDEEAGTLSPPNKGNSLSPANLDCVEEVPVNFTVDLGDLAEVTAEMSQVFEDVPTILLEGISCFAHCCVPLPHTSLGSLELRQGKASMFGKRKWVLQHFVITNYRIAISNSQVSFNCLC